MCAAAIGFYLIYTNSRPHAVALSIVILITILSLVGCMPLLNHSTPIFSLSQSDCYQFFMTTNADYNRSEKRRQHAKNRGRGGEDGEPAEIQHESAPLSSCFVCPPCADGSSSVGGWIG